MSGQDLIFLYRLDASDRVVEVDDAWVRFAAANDAAGLERRVLGRPLWDFIDGSTVRALYRALLERIRAEGREAVVPFRCDAPDRRRVMELHLRPREADGVELEGRILREESRPPVQILSSTLPRARSKLVRMCAWCKRVKDEGEWVEIEEVLARHEDLDRLPLPGITHGICPDCERAMDEAVPA